MGNLIYTCSSNSKGDTNARINDSSIWCPQIGQNISTQTYRVLDRAPTSSPTLRRRGTPLNGDCSRSTVEVLEAVSKQLMTQPPRR
uniref:AC4 n=1 Tax=Whitefly-associated begomovirus 3 TaxID=2169741 RepID=A0A0P0J5F6_9GEMI|nr:AC4 [Whitefly-associated begomovirus 3]